MTSRNREIDLQHRYFLHSKTSLWILQLAASRSFFGGWGTSISPHETGRYRTVLLPCDVETLNGTADTVALGWSDKKHTIDEGFVVVMDCTVDHGRGWEDVPCWLFVLSPLFSRPVAKGFGGYCLSFPQHLLWLHKVTFGRLVAARGFQKKINVLLQQVCWFPRKLPR